MEETIIIKSIENKDNPLTCTLDEDWLTKHRIVITPIDKDIFIGEVQELSETDNGKMVWVRGTQRHTFSTPEQAYKEAYLELETFAYIP